MNCPACKVVVPNGYTRCPRCQHVLPVTQRAPTAFGGTAMEDKRLPIVPIAIGAIVMIAIIAFFATRGGGKQEEVVRPTAEPTAPVVAAPTATPRAPIAAPQVAPTTIAPSPTAAADELLKALRRQRLWSTVDARVPRIDVRSQSCADPGMSAAIEAARPALRGAGLTALRCLEESGRVVFQRDL